MYFITCIAERVLSLQVTITSDPPTDNNTLCINGAVLLTCHVSDAAQPAYKWFTTKSTIPDDGSGNIKVIATDDLVQYYCDVIDVATNRSGQGNITIYGKGMLF